MDLRNILEEREALYLSPRASLSARSKGRRVEEDPCQVRTVYQHDRDKILHSKSFRRLKHKTQVFLAPEGDHYRTRLTHTLEVSQIARTVARALALNEDLTEAIALGHDLGHTPFGHAGERVLNELVPGGFHHVRQSLRVVDILEKGGDGLNLTWEVRDGIVKHSKGGGPLQSDDPGAMPGTLEGHLVRRCDMIAYVNHDLDDAQRAGMIALEDVPLGILEVLGTTHGRRIDTMVRDMISSSLAVGGTRVCQSPDVEEAILALRNWLYAHVYQEPRVAAEFDKASRILRELYGFFRKDAEALVRFGGRRGPKDSLDVSVADFLAGMTDRFAMNLYQRLFLPQPWKLL
ncbi:deoxyguanosinetriphosphate triphosphohydrolase [Geoalkalibacter sp.]|uniref:deoxyguanosinetriphosphate triphosphohydrolase n=1 Tax=Geoalkalibacter sp. TaxID=3041440 RepID=UPI00272DDCE4|nr:deoxyguanosinetriphosphate triphosphohydrolase [Geoalkalibacter sp.]